MFLSVNSNRYVSSDFIDFSFYHESYFHASLHAQEFLIGCQTFKLYIASYWIFFLIDLKHPRALFWDPVKLLGNIPILSDLISKIC